MSKPDLRKQYIQLAYDQLNPKNNDIDALVQVLTNWFCFKYNTTPNDPRLLGLRLDELLLLRMMNEIHDTPAVLQEIGPQADEFEDWVKKEMGTEYKTMEEMVESHEKMEEEEKAFANTLPEKIVTDFKSVRGE